jgi:DNA-binding transcriptional LysR family regulator
VASRAPVPRGRLRVSAPIVFAHVVLCPIAARFALAYPQVELEVIAEDRVVDPVDEGYDLVVRIDPPHDERLMGRRIFGDQRVVVAAPTMSLPSEPTHDAQGLAVPAVMFAAAPSGAQWDMRTRDGRVRTLKPMPVLRLSSLLMVRDAVLQGVGAALLPGLLVERDVSAGRLSCWGETGSPVEIWALYHSRRLLSAKVRAFMDMLPESRGRWLTRV